jgi:hypothetical protein
LIRNASDRRRESSVEIRWRSLGPIGLDTSPRRSRSCSPFTLPDARPSQTGPALSRIGRTSFAAPFYGSDAPIRLKAWRPCEKPIRAEPSLANVAAQWQAVIGDERVTVAEVIRIACERESANFGERADFAHAELREALLAVAGERGAVNSRRLGRWFAEVAGRIVDGSSFEQCGQRQGVAVWRLAGS